MSSEKIIISDDEDRISEKLSDSTESKQSPSVLNNFYGKYVFRPDAISDDKTGRDKAAKNLSSAFNFQYFIECTGEGGDSVPSGSNNVVLPSKSTDNNFKQYKTDGRNNHWQEFELPNIVKVEETVPEPAAVATRCISGVSVQLPVVPYPAQLSVMDKVIKGITHGEHCLIESPTGSGKTLALLCSSLAWQKKERERVEKLIADARPWIDSPSKFPGPSATTQADATRSDAMDSTTSTFCSPGTPTKRDKSTKKSKKAAYIDDDSDDEDAFVKKPVKKSTKCSDTRTDCNSCCSENGDDIKISKESEETSEKKSWKRKETSPDLSERDDLVSLHKKPKFSTQGPSGMPSDQQIPCTSPTCSPAKASGIPSDQPIAVPKVPRIIFGTRTHKQIKQVIKELKRTTYSKNLKMSILSSREHSCIKPLPNTFTSKTKHCKALMDENKRRAQLNKNRENPGSGCEYYDNKKALTGSRGPKDVWDIEDIVDMGRKRSACPYFAARDLADFAHIVFCPYNYIIDPVIRSSIQLSLDGDIILVDEGHNIEDTCRDTASLSIDVAEIQECIKELEEVIKMRPLSEEDHNDLFLYFKKYFHNWEDLFHNHLPLLQRQSGAESSYLMEGSELADTLNRHSIGYSQFEDFVASVNIVLAESRNTDKDDVRKRNIPTGAGTLLQSIVLVFGYFFKNNCQHLDNYNGIFVKKTNEWSRIKSESSTSYSLKISCMDPSLVFSGISSQARCVVLSSGTLTPMLSFSSELGTMFKHTLQARHVIRADQVWVGTIDSGPNGMPLEATYKNTSSTEWQDSMGQIILWVSQQVPNGILCFLSSYRLIEILQERWESTGLWQKLQEIKYVFTESKNMTEHDHIMTDYYSSVNEGAILFAVFRGKVSEGMDFKDHQARAVITVGIPYANVKDPMVDGKMKYNTRHQADRNLVSGRDWYSIQAFRALNQALGRCVRHKDDWGAIIMVDSRLKRDHFKQHISKWVQSFLANQHHDWPSFTTGSNSLDKFINYMQSQPQAGTLL